MSLLESPSCILPEEEVLSFIGRDGPFFQSTPHFEVREEQREMLQDVIRAFNDAKVALIEAGTGTGKSLAYLLPAILWSIKTGERILISTHTITLQEQLLFKDIPLLKKALNINFKAVLAKGMGNYLCLRRLRESLEELLLFPSEEMKELQKLQVWSETTSDGTKKGLSIMPSPHIWEKVACERDACNREKCPYYKECFFYKARKEALDAKIIIANHSLLLSDLAYREKNKTGLLPDYTRVIIDEAHHLEDVALEHMAETVSFSMLMKILGKLHGEKGGKIPLLEEKLRLFYKNEKTALSSLLHKINLTLPEGKNRVTSAGGFFFSELSSWLEEETKDKEEGEKKFRILEKHLLKKGWKSRVEASWTLFLEGLTSYITDLELILGEIDLLKNEKIEETTEGVRLDILSLVKRLQECSFTMQGFMKESFKEDEVRWIESSLKRGVGVVRIFRTSLNVAEKLDTLLFRSFSTVILCSATLAVGKDFLFLKKRVGIYTKETIEKIYPSSFDYRKQALLAIPQDLPTPMEDTYFESACSMIFDAIKIQPKGTFILNTSFSFLENAFSKLAPLLQDLRFSVFKQGYESKSTLIEKFQKAERPVLFATDSFWEGVDMQGGILKLVIITRLPFKVPDEPLVQALAEKILRSGGNPFLEDSLPDAVVKFKQGFGRLIRNRRDHGCVLCLDKRLVTKPYGKFFLNSLPNCEQQFLPKGELIQEMKRFYYSR